VRTHVQNMLHQLGLHSTPQLVAAARQAGLTTAPGPRGPLPEPAGPACHARSCE
jgi:hypothetical protein